MRKALYLMGILEDTDVEWIATYGSHHTVTKDAVLIREGEPIDFLYLLLDGRMTVSTRGREVAALAAGEIFGEISFVDSRPPLATVFAAQDSRVLAMPKQVLRDKLQSDPWFASRFYRALATFLADRLRMTSARMGYGSAAQDAGESEGDEMDLEMMETVSLAAVRFDKLQRRLRGERPH